jgi:cyclopropane-fatty-acyl-phospholipid synthase
MHSRREPVEHTFRYPVYCYALDLHELPELPRHSWLFRHNAHGIVSLWDRDYLRGDGSTLWERLLGLLRDEGRDTAAIARAELVTCARFLGYVFNPVNFFYCYGADGSVRHVVTEVNNTFGERHHYIIDDAAQGRASCARAFHVSPFNDLRGEYDFQLSDIRERLDIRINVVREGATAFLSQLTGKAVPFTHGNLVSTIAEQPLAATATMPRIMAQAAKLYFIKGLPVYTKPSPTSVMTFPVQPSLVQRTAFSVVDRYLRQSRVGRLHLRLPDATTRTYGRGDGPEAEIRIREWSAFPRLARGGDVGLGEAYTDGLWDTDSLVDVFRWFLRNQDRNDDRGLFTTWIARGVERLLHALRSNTPDGSRKNISFHYDLSNEFYRLWLDPTMMYSSAVWRREDESLEDAQRNKLDMIVRKAHLGPDHHVLEIGSGWGGFAIHAARTTGCRVTTITLSERQAEEARARIKAAGLEDRIEVRLVDYRHVEGQYDRIVSIEMLEAVGHGNLGTFFRRCDELLKPDGLAVIQVIQMPDQEYGRYLRHRDWIQKYIFPGCCCPSMTAIVDSMTRNSRFMVEHVENIGIHYSRTLREWRDRFMAARTQVRGLGFTDEFVRAWDYYLQYCEAGFEERYLRNAQLVLTRKFNKKLPIYPEVPAG